MSDNFYGTFQADDGSYSTNAAVLHQHQQQSDQAKNQSLLQQGLTPCSADFNNYFCSTTNINSITAATTAAVSSAFDAATTHSHLIGPTLRYYGGGYHNPGTYSSQQQQQHQQLIYNGDNSLSTQNILGENCAYNKPPTAALTLGAPLAAGGANYSSVTAANMSFSYNRNRYMPYSRAINLNGTAPYHHAFQTAGMPTRAVSSLSITTAPIANMNAQQAAYTSYSTYQPFANTHSNYPNLLEGAPLAAIISANDSSSSVHNLSSLSDSSVGTRPINNGCAASMCENVTRRNQNDAETSSASSVMDANAIVQADNNANGGMSSESICQGCTTGTGQSITLQITNLDYTMEESSLRNFLLAQLRPITPVLSLIFEGNSYAKVTVPDMFFAKQVVANLHRKKIGHKRMLVSYTRESSQTDLKTLRCQVAGLLKDVPYYTLPMYKFRELFQARFKSSISVLDLYKLPDICTITVDNYEEKFIGLQTGVISTLENSPLMEGLQHSVPYCTVHFQREQHKGWAEQEIEPLPNVWMTIADLQKIIYPLLKNHHGDIPIASLVHCISGQMKTEITPNENGVNLEHLVCCVQGIQVQVNNFGIKILGWLEVDKENHASTLNTSLSFNSTNSTLERSLYAKSACAMSDPLYQISREVIELVKMSPKSTMKFNRFIPAYHNHFGKQCRVADYGYTKLIELFEALATVVQIIGDGENRFITLTHRTQLRRFTSDLLRILRAHGNKAVLLSELPTIFAETQHRFFDVTDYGVCDIRDILDGLANSNVVVMSRVKNGDDMFISMPKRKQTGAELEKTILFAGEMVELFRNAPQYTILFEKFVRSYHYHFAYQCRLSDYGFLKLADLMEAIQGVVEMEQTSDEDKKIYLSAKVARRVFAEQCEELIHDLTGTANTCMKLEEVLQLHKKKFGYQIQPQTLGVSSLEEGVELLPYIELTDKEKIQWITCHREDAAFRSQCYRACKLVVTYEASAQTSPDDSSESTASSTDSKKSQCKNYALTSFMEEFNKMYEDNISESSVRAMKHLIEIFQENDVSYVRSSEFLKFLLCIINVLEKRSSIMLSELRRALHCNIRTTFEFGYPNLFTVLSAYNDIFIVHVDTSQDRREISLQPNCELHLSALINRSGLLNSTKTTQASKQKPSRPLRPPLSENQNRRNYSNQGPPAKMRALSTTTTTNENTNYQVSQAYKASRLTNNTYVPPQTATAPPPLKLQRTTTQRQKQPQPIMLQTQTHPPQHIQQALQTQQQMHANLAYDHNNNHFSSNGNSSIYSVASHNSSLNTSASSSIPNDMSFNSSFGPLNHSLNSTNLSMTELNYSGTQLVHAEFPQAASIPKTSLIPTSGANVKLWDRRYVATTAAVDVAAASVACHQQPMSMLVENVGGGDGGGQASLIMSTSESAAMDAHRQQQHQHQLQLQQQQALQSAIERSMILAQSKIKQEPNNEQNHLHMYPMFEPPKPDTPPSNTMPYWIDPIWSQNKPESESAKGVVLPIKIPELKSFNVVPMVLSPYTLSKIENLKQQVFNFDNHDRKIA
ncbi:uncharacterized protein Marf1 [Eurosta solidaginis]|uniref:uncharacterized protein Marf1 n=1 Tax=Eurosta solidaginis TaxID=178769 RepID=UPI0035307F3A